MEIYGEVKHVKILIEYKDEICFTSKEFHNLQSFAMFLRAHPKIMDKLDLIKQLK